MGGAGGGEIALPDGVPALGSGTLIGCFEVLKWGCLRCLNGVKTGEIWGIWVVRGCIRVCMRVCIGCVQGVYGSCGVCILNLANVVFYIRAPKITYLQ